jgi:hypothetical protein
MRTVKVREGEEFCKESVAGRESVVRTQPELRAETKNSDFINCIGHPIN